MHLNLTNYRISTLLNSQHSAQKMSNQVVLRSIDGLVQWQSDELKNQEKALQNDSFSFHSHSST